jgi:hypothetical protein
MTIVDYQTAVRIWKESGQDVAGCMLRRGVNGLSMSRSCCVESFGAVGEHWERKGICRSRTQQAKRWREARSARFIRVSCVSDGPKIGDHVSRAW